MGECHETINGTHSRQKSWHICELISKKTNTAWKVSVFGVFLVLIFLHSDWIRRYNPYLPVFSPNVGKCRPEKLRIRTLWRNRWIAHFRQMLAFTPLEKIGKTHVFSKDKNGKFVWNVLCSYPRNVKFICGSVHTKRSVQVIFTSLTDEPTNANVRKFEINLYERSWPI